MVLPRQRNAFGRPGSPEAMRAVSSAPGAGWIGSLMNCSDMILWYDPRPVNRKGTGQLEKSVSMITKAIRVNSKGAVHAERTGASSPLLPKARATAFAT